LCCVQFVEAAARRLHVRRGKGDSAKKTRAQVKTVSRTHVTHVHTYTHLAQEPRETGSGTASWECAGPGSLLTRPL
jgi:hypothetical protein